MVWNLILSCRGLKAFILSVPAFGFFDQGGMVGALAIEEWGVEVVETSAFSLARVARSPISYRRESKIFQVFLLLATH